MPMQTKHTDNQPHGQEPSAVGHQSPAAEEVFPQCGVSPPNLRHHLLVIRRGLQALLEFGHLRRLKPGSVKLGEIVAKHRCNDQSREDSGNHRQRQQHVLQAPPQGAAPKVGFELRVVPLANGPRPRQVLPHDALLRAEHEAPSAGHATALFDLVVGPSRHTAQRGNLQHGNQAAPHAEQRRPDAELALDARSILSQLLGVAA